MTSLDVSFLGLIVLFVAMIVVGIYLGTGREMEDRARFREQCLAAGHQVIDDNCIAVGNRIVGER